MKVEILKNIKYKGKLIERGCEIEIGENDIGEFVEKEIIDVKYLEIEEKGLTKQSTIEDSKGVNTIGIDNITKDAIIGILTEKGIEHNPRDKKENLYNLMVQGD
ncbi:hypothetical protein [Sporanaerobacter acetigenes]|uniref:hypothetical protein n=1 Tax=Sporanaerobacter acetigenes TaxID=165813 RepID=UPI00104F20D2|nr:hypothetical protein [Sporanaerobacter acetigenes]